MQDAEQPRPAQAASRPAQLWSANVVAAPSSGPRSAAAHSLAKIKWRTAPASIYQPSTKSIKQEHEEMLALYHEAQAAGYVVDPAGGSARARQRPRPRYERDRAGASLDHPWHPREHPTLRPSGAFPPWASQRTPRQCAT